MNAETGPLRGEAAVEAWRSAVQFADLYAPEPMRSQLRWDPKREDGPELDAYPRPHEVADYDYLFFSGREVQDGDWSNRLSVGFRSNGYANFYSYEFVGDGLAVFLQFSGKGIDRDVDQDARTWDVLMSCAEEIHQLADEEHLAAAGPKLLVSWSTFRQIEEVVAFTFDGQPTTALVETRARRILARYIAEYARWRR